MNELKKILNNLSIKKLTSLMLPEERKLFFIATRLVTLDFNWLTDRAMWGKSHSSSRYGQDGYRWLQTHLTR